LEGRVASTPVHAQRSSNGMFDAVGRLDKGHYAFVVVVRTLSCTAKLFGCSKVNVGKDSHVRIDAQPISTRDSTSLSCLSGTACDQDGVCLPSPDGGEHADSGEDDRGGDSSEIDGSYVASDAGFLATDAEFDGSVSGRGCQTAIECGPPEL